MSAFGDNAERLKNSQHLLWRANTPDGQTHCLAYLEAAPAEPKATSRIGSTKKANNNQQQHRADLNEYSLNAKYPELLKEIAPGITQVAVLRDASQGAGIGDFAVIQAMAPLLRMQVNAIDLREAGEIESAVAAFAHSPNGGSIGIVNSRKRFCRVCIGYNGGHAK